ncbi:MAG TPA: hypothetical protein VFK50_09410 [Sphingomicrobium sp.]|nr:hypothetical protein [Sphingomicrobium sp.]
MAGVVAKASEPTLAAIKLAWWRDRLEGLDKGQVPAEPRLKAVAADLFPRGVTGSDLAALEEGWAALLHQDPDADVALARGSRLFALAARLVGAIASDITPRAGRLYAAGQLRRLGIQVGDGLVETEIRGIPRRLRPLTGLAALSRRDLRLSEPEATPARAFALLRHRWTGCIG